MMTTLHLSCNRDEAMRVATRYARMYGMYLMAMDYTPVQTFENMWTNEVWLTQETDENGLTWYSAVFLF